MSPFHNMLNILSAIITFLIHWKCAITLFDIEIQEILQAVRAQGQEKVLNAKKPKELYLLF